ncbi:MAG: molybdenum ABC transporter ATP-binding protein [Burkholderiaceae bacterium]
MKVPGFELQARYAGAIDGITALFGRSGSGKSTILRCIAGLEPAVSGHLRLDNEVWLGAPLQKALPAHARGVGFVFQDARLFPHLSAAGNLRYAEKRSRQLSDTRIEFDDVVQALDLAPLLERRPATLSGGERQRVAIGRALLTRPRLLLMDEPLSALDAARKAEILPYLERLPARFGVPALYVTHDIDEVTRLATRMIVLWSGRVIASGLLQDVLELPELQQVTGRFEAGVVLTTRVLRHDTAYCLTHLDHHGQNITVPLASAAVGSTVRVRIRSRDVALATRRPEGSSIRNVLMGALTQIKSDPLTPFAETLVDIGGARLRARVTREAIAELGLVEGAQVFALVKSIALG